MEPKAKVPAEGVQTERKAYSQPELVEYGHVAEITQAGGLTSFDNSVRRTRRIRR